MPAQDVPVSTRRRRVSVRSVVLLHKLHHVPEQNPHPRRPLHDERTAVSVPAAGVRPQTHQGGRPSHRSTAHHALTLRRQTGNFIAVLLVYFAARRNQWRLHGVGRQDNWQNGHAEGIDAKTTDKWCNWTKLHAVAMIFTGWLRSTVGGTPVIGRRTDPVLRSTFS